MATISTHVLDTSLGRPAAAVTVILERREGREWAEAGRGATDDQGRARDLASSIAPGVFRLRFDTAAYFTARDARTFFPYVEIVFEVHDAAEHYHVPLLISPFGYSTYRGS